MSPLIQNPVRTPTEVFHIAILTGIPARDFFNAQWLPNSNYTLKTIPSTTVILNKRAPHESASISCTSSWLQSSQMLLLTVRKLYFCGVGFQSKFCQGKTNLGQKFFLLSLYFLRFLPLEEFSDTENFTRVPGTSLQIIILLQPSNN